MNKETEDIFNLLKENNIKDLEKKVKDNINKLNFNAEDKNNKTIIDYIIKTNNYQLLAFIIKNKKINTLRNRHILKTPIKYGFNKIIDLLINYNIDLLRFRDNENLNIFCYCVKYNNIEAFKLLDKKVKEINKILFYQNLKDDNNINFFHYLIKNNIEKCQEFLDYLNIKNIEDSTDKNNNTILMDFYRNDKINETDKIQLSEYIKKLIPKPDLLSQETKTDKTLLHILSDIENYDIIIYYLKNTESYNLNAQDIKGQTIIHILIRKLYQNHNKALKILEVLNYIISNDKLLNYNITDIKLKTPLFLYLKIFNHYISDTRRQNKELIKEFKDYGVKLIEKSNLNTQDLNYNSPLHLLCKYDLFKYFKNIIKDKKINITLKDKDNKTPIDYLNSKNYDDFIELFTDNYINLLTKNKFVESVFNKDCLKDTGKCKEIIKDKIKNNDLSFLDITKHNLKVKNLIKNSNVYNFIYTGSSLDIICICKMLKTSYKNVYLPIDKKINTDDNIPIIQFYRSNNLNVYSESILDNSFIFWIPENNSLFFNPYIIKKIKKRKNKNIIIFIPLLIFIKEERINHMNLLFIVDNKIYHYDPYGTVNNRELKIKMFGDLLVKELNEDYEYVNPEEYLNKFGIQYFEEEVKDLYYFNDSVSYCIIWCFIFAKLYFDNRYLTFDKVIKYLLNIVLKNQINIKKMVKDNLINLIEFRNHYLIKLNIDINDYFNNNINSDIYLNIISEI